MNIEHIKSVIFDWASKEPLVREVHIFGSRARNDFKPDSDIDIAVRVNKQPQDGSEYSTWMFSAETLTKSLQSVLPYRLQLEWYDPAITEIVDQGIKRSSILVYRQSN